MEQNPRLRSIINGKNLPIVVLWKQINQTNPNRYNYLLKNKDVFKINVILTQIVSRMFKMLRIQRKVQEFINL